MAEYSLASKQTNQALRKNETSPKDFTLVKMIHFIWEIGDIYANLVNFVFVLRCP